MIYAVIDTNVLVSALLSRRSDAATVQVVSAIYEKGICPLFNGEIIAEYEEAGHYYVACFFFLKLLAKSLEFSTKYSTFVCI